MKDFFKNNKSIFVLITVLLWIIGLIAVIVGVIDFPTYLAGLITISTAVIALYQWYSKKEVIEENIELKSQIVKSKRKESLKK